MVNSNLEIYSPEERSRMDGEFSRLSSQRIHYLDHAGSALYSERQLKEICDQLSKNLYCNPHTNVLVEEQMNVVREKVLAFFNTSSSDYDVVFTSGATESLKILAETFDFQTNGHFMYLKNVHNSVVGMRAVVKTKNVHVMDVEKFLNLPYEENEPNSVYSLSNSLMVYPAQCNFNGYKYPLSTIDKFHSADLPVELKKMSKNWFVCLDAANYVSTSFLDLGKYRPDFVACSFYKIFGYPTGLGALLVSKRGQLVMQKIYHGGGTVDFALSDIEMHKKRQNFHERFEDGTPAFLSIVSLLSGFETIQRLVPEKRGLPSMKRISLHVFNLAKSFYKELRFLRYSNGQSLVTFYNQTEFGEDDQLLQGGIVTFNVHRSNGDFVGFREIEGLAEMNKIFLRVGCFCNPGACQTNLQLDNREIMQMIVQGGQQCNGDLDAITTQPFGFVRVSVGYMTKKENLDVLLRVLKEYFLGQFEIPQQLKNGRIKLLQIRTYPLKHAAPLILSSQWELIKEEQQENKLKFDGLWSVVNEFGVVLTAKQVPELGRIRVFISEKRNLLRLIYPEMNHLDLSLKEPLAQEMQQRTRKGFEPQDNLVDCGEKAAEWLQDVLAMKNVRLVKQKESEGDKIPVDSYFTKVKPGNPLKIINLSSVLHFLSIYGIKSQDEAVEEFLQVFRPNLIVYGGESGIKEQSEFRVEDLKFKVEGRVIKTHISPWNSLTGEKVSPIVANILQENESRIRLGFNVKVEFVGQKVSGSQIPLLCNH